MLQSILFYLLQERFFLSSLRKSVKSKNLYVKGAGTWSRSLTGNINKHVLVFGESTIQELIELARASQQHKKAQRLLAGPAPKKEKKKGGALSPKKERFFWLRTSLKKSYWLFILSGGPLRLSNKSFEPLSYKGYYWNFLLHIFKIIRIDQIDPQFFASMTSIWELLHFLLGGFPHRIR